MAPAGDLFDHLNVGFGDVARNVEAGLDGVAVQHVQDTGGCDAGAVFGHGHEAGELGEVGVAVQP